MTAARIQINFEVEARTKEALDRLAKDAGLARNTYAKMLFNAAFAARTAPPTGDQDLDTQVARVGLLWGAQFDTAEIEMLTGIPEARVLRIIEVWRDELKRVGE